MHRLNMGQWDTHNLQQQEHLMQKARASDYLLFVN
jgi:hypothetical protein